MEDRKMTRYALRNIVFLCTIGTGFIPVPMLMAQDDMGEQQLQEERLDDLFIGDNTAQDVTPEERMAERVARRAEFEKNHPEAAARLEERRAAMEKRRAEMEAQRKAFEEKYPDAVVEMKAWREEDKSRREQNRVEMETRRADFEAKYPDAAAEMKAMREAAMSRRNGLRDERVQRRHLGSDR